MGKFCTSKDGIGLGTEPWFSYLLYLYLPSDKIIKYWKCLSSLLHAPHLRVDDNFINACASNLPVTWILGVHPTLDSWTTFPPFHIDSLWQRTAWYANMVGIYMWQQNIFLIILSWVFCHESHMNSFLMQMVVTIAIHFYAYICSSLSLW